MRAWLDHDYWKEEHDARVTTEQKQQKRLAGAVTEHGKERLDCFFGVYLTVRADQVFYGVGSQGQRRRKNKRLIDVRGGQPEWKDSDLEFNLLVDLVRSKILPALTAGEKETKIFTRTKRNGVTYHANPCHGKHKLAKQHWANFEFQSMSSDGSMETKVYPCHMLCILEVAENPSKVIHFDCGTKIEHAGFYAMVHRATAPIAEKTPDGEDDNHGYWPDWEFGSLAEPNQNIVHCLQKQTVDTLLETEGEEVVVTRGPKRQALLVMNCKSIFGPLIGVRDHRDDRADLSKLYYFLTGQDTWGQCLYNMAVKGMTVPSGRAGCGEEGEQDEDEEEEEEGEGEDRLSCSENDSGGEGEEEEEDDEDRLEEFSDGDNESEHDDEEEDEREGEASQEEEEEEEN
jgi:hypothetical protein